MHRTAVGLSALLLSIRGAPALAIPPPPPNNVRVVQVLDDHTIVVAPYGDPFAGKGGTAGLIESPSQGRSAGLRPLGLVGGNGSLLCQNPLLPMPLPT